MVHFDVKHKKSEWWRAVLFGENPGDMLVADSNREYKNMSVGTEGQILTVVDGLPAWADAPAGTGYNQYHYIIYKEDSTYYSVNTETGAVTSNSDFKTLFESVLANEKNYLILEGIYELNDMLLDGYNNIKIHGRGSVIIRANDMYAEYILYLNDCDSIEIANITFSLDAELDTTNFYQLYINGGNNIIIRNCIFDKAVGSYTGWGIYVYNIPATMHVSNCVFSSTSFGGMRIYLHSSIPGALICHACRFEAYQVLLDEVDVTAGNACITYQNCYFAIAVENPYYERIHIDNVAYKTVFINCVFDGQPQFSPIAVVSENVVFISCYFDMDDQTEMYIFDTGNWSKPVIFINCDFVLGGANSGVLDWDRKAIFISCTLNTGKWVLLQNASQQWLIGCTGGSDANRINTVPLKYFEQASQPGLYENGRCAIWRDTTNNKTYFIARANSTDDKVELL